MNEKIMAPLPWEWFDFLERPQAMSGDGVLSVDHGGASRVYKVEVDGRGVPFKFFQKDRRAAETSRASRPLLILLHGMGLGTATFRGVSGYLFETHDLALVDYSNLGGDATHREWPHGGVAIKTLAEAVWRIADAIGAERVSLGGNSLGGALCLIAALRAMDAGDSRLERLVLSSPACYPQRLPKMYRRVRVPLLGELLMTLARAEALIGGVEYIGYVDKNRFDPELRQRYLAVMTHRANRFRLMDLIRHLPANARDTTMAIHLPRLGELRRPVLVTWGGQDKLLAEGAGERLAATLPNCVLEVHSDLAHLPHEEAPDRVGRRWAAFLNDADFIRPVRV